VRRREKGGKKQIFPFDMKEGGEQGEGARVSGTVWLQWGFRPLLVWASFIAKGVAVMFYCEKIKRKRRTTEKKPHCQ